MTKNSRRPAGMIAVNAQISAAAGQPATLKQLLQCLQSNATLRRAWRNARKNLVVEQLPQVQQPQQPQQPQQQQQQQQQQQPEPAAKPPEAAPAVEQRPPSPRPIAWGSAVCNDGGGVKWGDGAAPAKALPEADK